MASPVAAAKVGGIRNNNYNKTKKEEKLEEKGSTLWMKLKKLFSCFCKVKSSSRGNNKRNDAKGKGVVVASSTNSNSPHSEINYYSHLKQFTYRDLKLATRNFKPENIIGEGGFGKVFKGWITSDDRSPSKPGVGLTVAVKTLNKEGKQGHKEWVAEINYLGALQHPNLVKLFGYCFEGEDRMLVYEYMPRGSLENHLFRRIAKTLPWTLRMKIMLDAAKGLAFLHEEAEKPIIYRDFKTSNILLDLDFTAKLSDFGLARDAPEGDQTHVSTQVMGTQGYAAPEYVQTGHLTSMSDVYSFGVVLLEMLSGKRAMDRRRPYGEQSLVEYAKPYLKPGGRFYHLIDPKFNGQYSARGAYKATRIAAKCISKDPKARPMMSEIVTGLKNVLEHTNDMPCSTLPSPPLSSKGLHVGSSSSSSPNPSRHGGGNNNNGVNKYGLKVGPSSSASATSTPTRFYASPLNIPPFLSPNPSCSRNS